MIFGPPPFWKRSRGDATLIDRTAGTNIGNMTSQAGLAAVFDGITDQNGTSSAAAASGDNGWAGKTLAAPTAIDRVVIYGANDQGYVNGNNPSVEIRLYGKNGAAPSSSTDGTLLGTITFTDTATTDPRTITSTDNLTAYDHVFVSIIWTSNAKRLAEMEIYGWQ